MLRRFTLPLAAVVSASLLLAACGRPLVTPERTYPTVGVLSTKSDKVCYEISPGNLIWSLVLIEGIIFPVYFIGFSIMNPTRLKDGPQDRCAS